MFRYLIDWLYVNSWWLLVGAFAIWNWRALPLMWHVRLYSVMFKHYTRRKSDRVTFSKHGGCAIFEPIITTASCVPMDIDVNLHKSNSTFFLDLDINRIHLLAVLFKPVLNARVAANSDPKTELGVLRCILGAVSCQFRREIKPLEKYEVWTRVLCWDKKWLYIVSHFVTANKVAPMNYSGSTRAHHINSLIADGSVKSETEHEGRMFHMDKSKTDKLIRATAISKYVFKQGRRTVPPEDVMRELRIIPSSGEKMPKLSTGTLPSEEPHKRMTQVWDDRRIQQENERGLRIVNQFGGMEVNQFGGMDALHEAFSGDSSDALGYFSDSPW